MKPYRTLDLSQANAESVSSATARERSLNHTSVPAMRIIIAHAVGASHQRSSTENDSSISVVINHLATLWLTRPQSSAPRKIPVLRRAFSPYGASVNRVRKRPKGGSGLR